MLHDPISTPRCRLSSEIVAGAALVLFLACQAACQNAEEPFPSDRTPQPRSESVVISIVCDNNPLGERVETAWGFACVIQGLHARDHRIASPNQAPAHTTESYHAQSSSIEDQGLVRRAGARAGRLLRFGRG